MPSFVFPQPTPTAVPIIGTDALFAVRRVLCVGRNYAAHRREMGGDDRDPPFFFSKPSDALVTAEEVPYPSRTHDLHHEIELVVALGAGGEGVTPDHAKTMIFGYATGVDLTRRDLQAAAKTKGQPWDAAKGFDASAPISPIRRAAGAPPSGAIRLWVNDDLRQEGLLADMIWGAAEIISEASKLWRLAPGDLIFTGTPEGVGPLRVGDRVRGDIEDVGALNFTIAAKR
jgi:fumarylpyruvate hydrolase